MDLNLVHEKDKNNNDNVDESSLDRHARDFREPPRDQRRPRVEPKLEPIARPARDRQNVLHRAEQLQAHDVIRCVRSKVEVPHHVLHLTRALHVVGRHGHRGRLAQGDLSRERGARQTGQVLVVLREFGSAGAVSVKRGVTWG